MSGFERRLLLSASFPSGIRGPEVEPYDPAAIADAVTAVVRAALLADLSVIFGGHPTITPLVLMIGTELRVEGKVEIFQSRWFEDQITPETIRLVDSGVGIMHWTERQPTLAESLREMRNRMIDDRPMGAVFVGGMSGIYDEHELLKSRNPDALRVPLTAPGGAAARIEVEEGHLTDQLLANRGSRHYPYLAALIVQAITA